MTLTAPIDVIASILADGRTAGANGVPRVGRATRKKAQQVLDAFRDAGLAVVPVEPTEEMQVKSGIPVFHAREVYRAMIAAAP